MIILDVSTSAESKANVDDENSIPYPNSNSDNAMLRMVFIESLLMPMSVHGCQVTCSFFLCKIMQLVCSLNLAV